MAASRAAVMAYTPSGVFELEGLDMVEVFEGLDKLAKQRAHGEGTGCPAPAAHRAA